MLWANSANNKLMIFFRIFPRKQNLTFHANVSIGDNLHEMSQILFSGKNKKNISI